MSCAAVAASLLVAALLPPAGRPEVPSVVSLPAGVRAVHGLALAFREKTPTRERVSINGLWRWQPAAKDASAVPAGGWGWFKVPGSWPGIGDYMHKETQAVIAHPDWGDTRFGRLSAAWYQREIEVPEEWRGRRITIRLEYLNSWAAVFIDGKKAGEVPFPGGELDLSAAVRPGGKHALSLLVVAMPLKGVMLSYSDSARAKEVQGEVERRGLCGDAWLEGSPAGERVTEVSVATSVAKGELAVGAELAGLKADRSYRIRARVLEGGREVKAFKGPVFRAADLRDGRSAFTVKWMPEKLWDTDAPGNQYDLAVTLEAGGKAADTALPVRFGFREFAIRGRDFMLNGTRIHLSVLPVDNAQVSEGLSTYAAARETFERLKAAGFNAVYTHNYGCEPGSHLGFTELLKAADDTGMLAFFSMPHFGHYDWKDDGADSANGYARHADWYVRAARNHPSVVMYAMSHNGCGYRDDMNPDLLADGNPVRDRWSMNGARRALRAEAIVAGLDPTRIVYHHSGGDLGSMHTVNFYGNFIPIQEMSDWFATWSEKGVKPLFPCEFGVPLTWDWAMYRGWYKGEREFGSAPVPWEYCIAEWSSQFQGDSAFRITEHEKRNLRWEAEQFRAGRVWHRWDYPVAVGDGRFEDTHGIFARYFTDNLRAMRAQGLSAFCLWDAGGFWRAGDSADRSRKELQTDWDRLQRPGFSPDFIEARYEHWYTAFERADWRPTIAGKAILRNNGPRLGFIGGKPGAVTERDHLYHPGETVEKTLVVINDSRRADTCEAAWSAGLPDPAGGAARVTVETGDQARIPISFALPADLAPGDYRIRASFRFGSGEVQEDEFGITVMVPAPAVAVAGRIAIWDPKVETTWKLAALGVRGEPVGPGADLDGVDLLIIGRHALSAEGPAPALSRVRDGLKVVVFEQSSEALEKRLGFRTTEYGLREVFARVPDSPLLAGLGPEHLRDWRGEATTMPPRLAWEPHEKYGQTVKWCGIDETRVWRCGNRGSVASVLIEKPARGDFLPVLEGGYSLQYSPLIEYREGNGMVLFCQMDVTGRTGTDPSAEKLVANILSYADAWKPSPRRSVVYAGDPAGLKHLESAGIAVKPWAGKAPGADQVLVTGPGAAKALARQSSVIRSWIGGGGRVLALGLAGAEANAFLPAKVTTATAEHIAAVFDPEPGSSPLAGVGPADVHNRAPRGMPLVTGGARVVGDGVLAASEDGSVAFCQLVPWQYAYAGNYGLKRTFRRTAFLVNRLLANAGAAGTTPLLDRFGSPVDPAKAEQRWLEGLYLDVPEEWDDPYRFFRW